MPHAAGTILNLGRAWKNESDPFSDPGKSQSKNRIRDYVPGGWHEKNRGG
jgi:hypothetical protein